MDAKIETSFLKIGVNNQLQEALETGKIGIRFIFMNDDKTSRFEIVLNEQEALKFSADLDRSLKSLFESKQQIKGLNDKSK